MAFRTPTQKILMLAMALALSTGSASALAQPPQVQNVNGIAFVTGGVGDESMAELADLENQFDLKLFLVGQSGSYLSDINVTIIDAQGKGVLLTTSEGPLLLAKLASGTYTVKATKNGHTLEQKLIVTLGQLRTIYLRFPNE